MKETTSQDQQRPMGSDTASDLSRLSLATITPTLANAGEAEPAGDSSQAFYRTESSPCIDNAATAGQVSQRSHSLRSHTSHNTSSTHDDVSPFDVNRELSRLVRSGSGASTTPTSPETELSIGQITSPAEAGANKTPKLPAAFPALAPSTASGEPTKRVSGLSAVGILAIGAGECEEEQREESPPLDTSPSVPAIRARGASISSMQASTSNRNKPLPIPIELSITPASPLNSSWPEPPALPPLDGNPAKSPSIPHPSRLPVSPVSIYTASTQEGFSADSSHRPSLRSMFNRSSKIFRPSAGTKGPNASQGTADKFIADLEAGDPIGRLSPALVSDSSLPWSQHSSSPPTTVLQQSSLGKTSYRSQPFEWTQSSPGPPKPSPPIPPARSHSPFTFRRGNSWLGGSKLDYLNERHLQTPSSSQPGSSGGSFSSHGSSPDVARQHRLRRPTSPSQSDSMQAAGPHFSVSRPATEMQASSQAGVHPRPPLNRTRSKSMDVLDRYNNDARLMDIKRLDGPRANDSIAVGTTSIIEVDALPFKEADERKSADWSRLSRLLTRKSSALALREAVDVTSDGKDSPQEEADRVRVIGLREGALSRLTESLRSKKPSVAVAHVEADFDGDQATPSPGQGPKRERHRSSGSVGAFFSAHSRTRKDKEDVKAITAPSTDAQVRWGQRSEMTSNVEQAGLKERSEIGALKAAQLSAALSGMDAGTALAALPSATLPDVPSPTSSPRNSAAPVPPPRDSSSIRSADNQVTSPARSAGHVRRRTMSFTRLMEPFRGKSRPPSRSGADSDEGELANADILSANETVDDFDGAAHDTTSTTVQHGLPRSKSRQLNPPPSSYRAPSSENVSRLPKSESEPVLQHRKRTPSALSHKSSKSTNARADAIPSLAGASSSASRSTNSSPRKVKPTGRREAWKDASAISDSEGDQLPPPRSSSIMNLSGAPATVERRRAMSRPSLTIETATSGSVSINPPARPMSALGMTAELERGVRRTSGGRGQQQGGPATLSIADDLEFLQALENVRRVHQDRIKRQDEEASKIADMARLGMASGNRRVKAGDYARGRQGISPAASQSSTPSRIPLIRRSSSADGRYSSTSMAQRHQMPPSQTSMQPSSPNSPPGSLGLVSERPSALELGVGKASGKMRDGAILNDDDWKREVKALFVIREIVLTERSYAQHLEALLQAVRAMYPPTARKASLSTGTNLSRSPGPIPPHITLMRTLLPQLVALSRSLANRIDENPTAAGVGAAFRLVSSQMEATFVAWSSVATEIMDALRSSERAKSKSKDRIGLITLEPLEHTTLHDRRLQTHANGFVSVPTSPTSSLAPSRILSRTAEETVLVNSPTSATFDETPADLTRAKRRSTLSGISPSLAASLRAKAMGGTTTESSSRTPPLSQSLGKRAMGAVVSSNRPPLPTKARKQSIGWDSDFLTSRLPLTSSASNASTTADTPPRAQSTAAYRSLPVKRLSALDVAIMPTQRIPRYLLLLRNLNANTPPQSLSHVRLQRSLDFVKMVASSCDRASKSVAAG